MFLTYRPNGGAEQTWTFVPGKLRTFDTEAIERVTGWNYGTDFLANLQRGNERARRALLWMMLRREHPPIKFDDIDVAPDELELAYDKAELAELRTQFETAPFDTETQRAAAYAAIDADMATAPEPPGKASANSDA